MACFSIERFIGSFKQALVVFVYTGNGYYKKTLLPCINIYKSTAWISPLRPFIKRALPRAQGIPCNLWKGNLVLSCVKRSSHKANMDSSTSKPWY